VPKLYAVKDGKVYVTTSTGTTVQCLPYWNEVMLAGSSLSFPDKPDVPTYEVEDADGDKFTREHTQESIDDSKTSDADRELWASYLAELEQYNEQVRELNAQKELMRTRMIALKATRIVPEPDLDLWARESLELYGLEMPSDPRERKLMYFASEVIKVELDGAAIMAGIARASGMTEDQLDSIEELFPDPLGSGRRTDAQADQDEAAT